MEIEDRVNCKILALKDKQAVTEMEKFAELDSGARETAESSNDISMLDLLIVVGARKRFLLISTLAVGTVALMVSLLIPKSYTATITILPPQQASSLSAALLSQVGNLGALGSLAGGSLGLKNPADMPIALLRSRSVEDAMIQRFDLMKLYKSKVPSDARKSLEKHTSIDSNIKDGLIRIEIEDRDPKRASNMANAYVDEYQKFSQHLAIGEAGQRRLFFERQLVEAKNNLANAEEALKASQQKSGMIQLDSQARALIESVAALRAAIAAKEVEIQSLSLSETPSNPDIRMAREQLAALQSQLRRLGGTQSGEDNEMIFELLAKQFEVAKLDEAREGAVIQVVDPAVPPDKKSFPKLSLIVPGVTFLWVLLAIFGILFLEGIRVAGQRPADYHKLQAFKAIWRGNANM
jgi:tyrosine-protein kinase Etk/Wzc